MWRKIISLILMLSCFALIFYFSSQVGSVSSSVSNKVGDFASNFYILKRLMLLFPLRKMAHFSLYAMTFITVLFFISSWFNLRYVVSTTISIGVVFIYACSDEFHQSFIGGRSAEFRDVLIDCLGALSALIVISSIRCIYINLNKRRSKYITE